MAVAKSGRTTGLSCGFVEGVNGTIVVDYPAECGNPSAGTAAFTNQVIVNDIVSPGDSGSLIVDAATAQPLALVSASSADGLFSTGNPAGDILAALTATTGSTFTFVGGAQHPVSCLPSSQSSIQSPSRGQQSANPPAMPPLAREEVINAIAVQSRHEVEIMRNSSVIGVAVGRSQGDSKRAALLVFVERGRSLPPLPTRIEGVAVQVILTGRFSSGAIQGKQRSVCGRISSGRNN